MAKLAGGTPPPKPVRTPPIKRPPVPVVTPRGTFTPGVQPWVNPRAAESAAIGQAVAGAINTVAGAITTGPGGQVGRGSIGVGDWRNLAANIPSAIPTRTVGPVGRVGLPAGAGFTTGVGARGGALWGISHRRNAGGTRRSGASLCPDGPLWNGPPRIDTGNFFLPGAAAYSHCPLQRASPHHCHDGRASQEEVAPRLYSRH